MASSPCGCWAGARTTAIPDNFIGYHFAHPVGQPKTEDCYANDQLAQLLIDGAKEPDVAKRTRSTSKPSRSCTMIWLACRLPG